MKQNNRRTKLKAVVAVVLVMASLFAISTVVSAGFVEDVFEEVCEMMTTSSNVSQHEHTLDCYIRVVYVCEANGASCSLGKQGCPGGGCRTEYLERECGY